MSTKGIFKTEEMKTTITELTSSILIEWKFGEHTQKEKHLPIIKHNNEYLVCVGDRRTLRSTVFELGLVHLNDVLYLDGQCCIPLDSFYESCPSMSKRRVKRDNTIDNNSSFENMCLAAP